MTPNNLSPGHPIFRLGYACETPEISPMAETPPALPLAGILPLTGLPPKAHPHPAPWVANICPNSNPVPPQEARVC